jgi:copper resistance protein D
VDLLVRWVHALAAVTWLGGMLFIALILVPVIRRVPDPLLRLDLISQTGKRFRTVGWIALGLLVATGAVILLRRPWLLRAPAFQAKAGLVLLTLVLSALHDFVLGPRAGKLPPSATAPRRRLTWIARLNVLVVLTIVLLALRG